jgi:hypothetical protein
MTWLKGMFGNSSSTSTTGTTGGTYGVVNGTTAVPNGGYYSGSGGGIGQISTTTYPYVTTGTGGLSNYGTIHLSGVHPRITTDKSIIDLDELGELISILKERFLIITPDLEKHEKYQALKKAYDHYKLIESMLGDESDNKS